jgi:hypothetical protein
MVLRWGIAMGMLVLAVAAPALAQTTPGGCHYQGNGRISSRNPGDQFIQSMMQVPRNRSCRAYQRNMLTTGIEQQPAHGRIEITDGNWVYTPARNYTGPDSATVVYSINGRQVRNAVTIEVR